MRLFLCTLAPMLTATILAVVGGERLSRRESVERTPYDRNRLLDFSSSFRSEVQRLETLYLNRLERVTHDAALQTEDIIKSTSEETIGISLVKIFRVPNKDQTIRIKNEAKDEPEILMEGRGRPFDPKRITLLTNNLFGSNIPKEGVWISTHNKNFRVHYRSPNPDLIVAFLIDFEIIVTAFREELKTWIVPPSQPLVEAEEKISVHFKNETLLSSGSNKSGPTAAIIPFRSIFGDLEIRAWDGVKNYTYRDPVTMVVTIALALFFLASGIILYWYQKRALRLAGERVSFVNRVSHELGSPLTNLALNIDLANESLQTNPSQTRKRLSIVTEEIERLSRLVANVLTFSRQEKETLELHEEHVLAHKVINEIIDSFRPSFERRNITIKTDLTPVKPCMLDSDAFRQIIGNLLSNIEKYAFSGKQSSISLLEKNEQLIIEVSDKGPGIPNKEKDRIFRPFKRVHHSTSEGSSGTGLGLAISRDLAVQMKGSLELLDTKSGSTFRLTLPIKTTLSVVKPDNSAA